MNNQNEVDADCKMFCQTIKYECNTVSLIVLRLCLNLWAVALHKQKKSYTTDQAAFKLRCENFC